IATADAAVVEGKALVERWDSESKRIAGIAKSGILDAQVREETQYQFKAAEARQLSAEAAVRKAKADRDKAAADVQAAEARGDVARADASRAEAMLGYAKIRAPYDGVGAAGKVDNGDLVQPTGGKSWLFTVARLDPVRIVVTVPEADAGLVQEKSSVKLSIRASQAQPFEGTVTRTSWVLEP